jgi:hypothetical protein
MGMIELMVKGSCRGKPNLTRGPVGVVAQSILPRVGASKQLSTQVFSDGLCLRLLLSRMNPTTQTLKGDPCPSYRLQWILARS